MNASAQSLVLGGEFNLHGGVLRLCKLGRGAFRFSSRFFKRSFGVGCQRAYRICKALNCFKLALLDSSAFTSTRSQRAAIFCS